MKLSLYILATTITVALAACSKHVSITSNGSFSLNRETELPVETCKSDSVNGLQICYDKLIEDSRCPKGGECFWAGIGVGQFSFHVNGQKHVLTLGTYDLLNRYHKDTVVAGYKVELIDLLPYPDFDVKQPATKSARVKITSN